MAGRKAVSNFCLLGLLAMLTACADGGATSTPTSTPWSPAPAAAPAAAAPQRLTSTEINEQCWMDPAINKVPDLDKRAKLVDKCVDQKTKAQQGM
jgi:hypothetical protein